MSNEVTYPGATPFPIDKDDDPKLIKRLAIAVAVLGTIGSMLVAVLVAFGPKALPLSTSVQAESGEYLASIGRDSGGVSIRAMGLANLFPRSAAYESNCGDGRQGLMLCNPRYELAQLNTLRPGEAVFIPSSVDLTARFARMGSAPIAIVVDTRSPQAAAIAAVYVRESERMGRSDTVWLTDGRMVRQYLPNRIDDMMAVSGIPGAVNVAVGSSGAETALLITTRDLTEGEKKGYLGVKRLFGHCAFDKCKRLKSEARANHGRMFLAGFTR